MKLLIYMNICILYYPVILLIGIYTLETFACISQDMYMQNFIILLFVIAQNWKQLKYLITQIIM